MMAKMLAAVALLAMVGCAAEDGAEEAVGSVAEPVGASGVKGFRGEAIARKPVVDWKPTFWVHGQDVHNALAAACADRHYCGQDVGLTSDECIAKLDDASIKKDLTKCDESAVLACLEAFRAAQCPLLQGSIDCACW